MYFNFKIQMQYQSSKSILNLLFILLSLFSMNGIAQVKTQTQAQVQKYVQGELIIKMRTTGDSTAGNQKMALSKLSFQKGMKLKMSIPEIGIHHFSIKPEQDLKATIDDLKQDPSVEYAEPNYILNKIDQADSANPIQVFSREDVVAGFATTNTQSTYQQSGAPVHLNEAWLQMTPTLQEVPIVAVIDTGIDPAHPVFQNSNALWVNPNEIANNQIDDDNNGFVDDVNGWNFLNNTNNSLDDDGHGTHVSGIVLGVTLDIFADPISKSPIQIMPLKFLGADGSGTTSQAIQAIYYAVNNGAKIINNSWGGPNYSAALHEAMAYAYGHGVLIVTASGNSKNNNDVTPIYPANLIEVPSLISVAATSDWDALASFSDYGHTTVHLAAPGVSILSTLPNNKFGYSSGTSMAAPFIAGLAALVLREASGMTGYQIKQNLTDNVTKIQSLQSYVISGGRADVLQSVTQAKAASSTQPYQPIYKLVYRQETRAPATSQSTTSTTQPKGCGTIESLYLNNSSGNEFSIFNEALIFILLLLPLGIWFGLRSRSQVNVPIRRRYDRFAMESEIKVKVGDKELVASMKSISVGGVSFDAETFLSKGGTVTIQLTSPDGRESVQVDGHVVWSEKNQAYGVQFDNAKEAVMSLIQSWTTDLKKI